MESFFRSNEHFWTESSSIFDEKLQELSENSLIPRNQKEKFLIHGCKVLKEANAIEKYVSCSLFLAENYFKEKKYGGLELIYSDIEKVIENDHPLFDKFHQNYKAFLMMEGELYKVKHLSLNYLKVLKKKKKYGQICLVVEDLEKEIKLDNSLYQFWLDALGNEGNLEGFDEVFFKYRKEILRDNFCLGPWCFNLQLLWEKKNLQWELYKEIYKNKLLLVLNFENEFDTLLGLSKFLNLYHNLLVLHDIEENYINYIENKVNIAFKKYNLIFLEKKLSGNHKDIKDKNGDLTEVEDKKITKNEKIPAPKKNIFEYEDLDLNKEEKFLLKFIKKIPPTFFEKNIKEWVECFVMMEAFRISDYLFSVYEAKSFKRNNNFEENVMFEYLRIETLFKRKKMKQAIFRSDLILCEFPLLDHERLSFLYIKAEALKSLNMRTEAIKCFKQIIKSDPFYRLSKKRLEELETCK